MDVGGRFGIGIIAAAALVLAGCGVVGEETLRDGADLGTGITAVRIDNETGGVSVTGGPGAPSLQRTVTYRGTAPSGPTHRMEGSTLVLAGCGEDCGVDYTVQVPAGLPVSGRTSAGAITLARVGRVDVETSSGAVAIDGAGAVRAHTSNGAITGRNLRDGDVDAATSNGRVELALGTPQNVRARTSNGAIAVTVPAETYRISAETNNGRTDLRIPNDPAGTHTLDLTTSNGDITVSRG